MRNPYEFIDEQQEILTEYLGTENFLDALCRAMSYDTREDLFRYICRCYEVPNVMDNDPEDTEEEGED